MQLLISLLLLTSVFAVQKFNQLPIEEDFNFQRNCFATYLPPDKPNTLLFCSKFSERACCPPSLDANNLEYFRSQFATGVSCRFRGDYREQPVAKIYCMNCDPEQPSYVRNMPYYNLRRAKITLDAENFILQGSPSARNGFSNLAVDECTNEFSSLWNNSAADAIKTCLATRNQQILVDKDWARNNLDTTNHVFGVFDDCMMQKSAPCLDTNAAILPNRGRFTCGNDPIMPSATCGIDDGNDTETSICVMNDGTVDEVFFPTNDICKYIMAEKCFNMDDFMTPDIAENFGFRFVKNAYCSEAEVGLWSSRLKSMMDNITDYASALDNFNPQVANGPACLMTKGQSITFSRDTLGVTTGFQHTQDEKCFSAGHRLSPSFGVTLLSLFCIVLVLML